jgi:hypothetical protein
MLPNGWMPSWLVKFRRSRRPWSSHRLSDQSATVLAPTSVRYSRRLRPPDHSSGQQGPRPNLIAHSTCMSRISRRLVNVPREAFLRSWGERVAEAEAEQRWVQRFSTRSVIADERPAVWARGLVGATRAGSRPVLRQRERSPRTQSGFSCQPTCSPPRPAAPRRRDEERARDLVATHRVRIRLPRRRAMRRCELPCAYSRTCSYVCVPCYFTISRSHFEPKETNACARLLDQAIRMPTRFRSLLTSPTARSQMTFSRYFILTRHPLMCALLFGMTKSPEHTLPQLAKMLPSVRLRAASRRRAAGGSDRGLVRPRVGNH